MRVRSLKFCGERKVLLPQVEAKSRTKAQKVEPLEGEYVPRAQFVSVFHAGGLKMTARVCLFCVSDGHRNG
jgi:hypothetical protein